MRNLPDRARAPGCQHQVRSPSLAQTTNPVTPSCYPHHPSCSHAMAGTLARPQAGGRMWLDIPHSPLPSETLGYQPSHASLPVSRGGIAVFVGIPNGTPPKTRRLKAEPKGRHLSNLPNPSASLRSVRCRGCRHPLHLLRPLTHDHASMLMSSGLGGHLAKRFPCGRRLHCSRSIDPPLVGVSIGDAALTLPQLWAAALQPQHCASNA